MQTLDIWYVLECHVIWENAMSLTCGCIILPCLRFYPLALCQKANVPLNHWTSSSTTDKQPLLLQLLCLPVAILLVKKTFQISINCATDRAPNFEQTDGLLVLFSLVYFDFCIAIFSSRFLFTCRVPTFGQNRTGDRRKQRTFSTAISMSGLQLRLQKYCLWWLG